MRDTAWAEVNVKEALLFYIPNSFTPDFDDYNQTFKPIFTTGFDPMDFTLLIYNRWGQIIFESHDPAVGWSGTYGAGNEISQDGTYIWKIDFKADESSDRKMLQGHVTLIL